jgi:peroxiredoxin
MNVARDSSEYYDTLADDYRLDGDLLSEIDSTLSRLEQAGIMRLPSFTEKEDALDERLEAVASAKFLIEEEGFTLEEAMNELEKRKSYLKYNKNEILEYLKTA